MIKEGSDLRARNLRNTVAVTVNKKISEKDMDFLHSLVYNTLESLNPAEFDAKMMLTMAQEIFNPKKDEYRYEDVETMSLNQMMISDSQISLSTAEENKHDTITFDDILKKNGNFRIQHTHVKALTTESFPRNATLSEVQSAIFEPFGKDFQITIPSRFIATLTVAFDDVKKDAKWQAWKAGHNIGQLAYLSSVDEDKRPEIKRKKKEFREVVDAILEFGELPLRAMYSIIIIDDDEYALNSSSKRFINRMRKLSEGSWVFKEESKPMVSFLSLLYSLPGQYSKTFKKKFHRFNILFKVNNSKIVPLYSDFKGFGQATMMPFGRTGQMQKFSMHPSDTNSNFSLIGPSGSGKSTWLNEFITSSLSTGDVVRSIDLGNSQKRTAQLAGGQFESFDEDAQTCLNFFTNIKTEMVLIGENEPKEMIAPEELITIIPMVGMMAGVSVSSTANIERGVSEQLLEKQLASIVEYAIQMAFDREGRQAGMQEVYEAFLSISKHYKENNKKDLEDLCYSLALAVSEYAIVEISGSEKKIGKYVDFYNGANNLEITKDYFVLELEKVKKKSPDFATIVTMGVLNRMTEEAYQRQDIFKWYVIDEASDPLKDPLFVRFLDNFALRIRKYGGGIGIITQSIKHFFVNTESKSLYDNMSFKIFLEQEEEHIEGAIDSGKLVLNAFTEQLMKSVRRRGNDYTEFMVIHRGQIMMSRLKLDPFSAWLYNMNLEGKKIIAEIRERLGLEELQAVEFLVNQEENIGITEEENLALLEESRKYETL